MSDLGRLDEALWRFGNFRPGVMMDHERVITDAARAYRDLLANGQRVEWCEEHRSALHVPNPLTEKRCDVWVAGRLDGWETKEPCRIVSKLLIDPTEDA